MNAHLFYTGGNYAVLYKSAIESNRYMRMGDTMTVQSAPAQIISIHPGYSQAKRLLDIVFTLLISPLILFVAAVVAVLIRLDSKGPIFYRQKRVGQNGVEFDMLKFRSMYVDNDDAVHREVIKQYMNGEILNGNGNMPYKMGDDPRITRVGR